MRKLLAIDAGGSSTRAAIFDLSGTCLALGTAGSGNPTAAGVEAAVAQFAAAVEHAVLADPYPTARGSSAVISLAGAESEHFIQQLVARIGHYGFNVDPVFEHDLMGTYYSGTIEQDGYALIAGTGAVAGRVADGRLEFARGGRGWLLGDSGSGFWIGQQVARAVIAALDRLGPETALTGLMLDMLGISVDRNSATGDLEALLNIEEQVYGARPVDLARFAPLAFDANAHNDTPAHDILSAAADSLAALLEAIREASGGGPIVLGGGILGAGIRLAPSIFSARLAEASGGFPLIPVVDGVVGTAVLGLRRQNLKVDAEMFLRLQDGVTHLRDAPLSASG